MFSLLFLLLLLEQPKLRWALSLVGAPNGRFGLLLCQLFRWQTQHTRLNGEEDEGAAEGHGRREMQDWQ